MIPVHWWKGFKNFGDGLTRLIVEGVSGQTVEHVAYNAPVVKLHAIGTNAHFAQPGDHLWGTGVRFPDARLREGLVIHAVRGPDSRDALLRQGFDCPEIYGDPALLLSRYYTPKRMPRQGIAVLPHYHDRWLRGGDDRLTVAGEPFDVVDRIASAEILVTSSLHAMIVADVFGTPVALVRSTEHISREPLFKYVDYLHSTGREGAIQIDVPAEEAARHPLPPPVFPDLQKLVDAFPRHVWPSSEHTESET